MLTIITSAHQSCSVCCNRFDRISFGKVAADLQECETKAAVCHCLSRREVYKHQHPNWQTANVLLILLQQLGHSLNRKVAMMSLQQGRCCTTVHHYIVKQV